MGSGAVYARHGSAGFNAHLDDVLQRLAQDVGRCLRGNLVALILGGGYGRGEGGIVEIEGVQHPYNDLDLVLVVKHKGEVSGRQLELISRDYQEELGIHVDFSRPLTVADVEHWPRWLMWFDLLNGHIVLSGPSDILETKAPPGLRDPLPEIEASRLLLNRGAGLLWAMRVVRREEPPPDSDFVGRNYYKCALALGDALLISHGDYATPYAGRGERLSELSKRVSGVQWLDIDPLYATALQFKFRPDCVAAPDFDQDTLAQLALLWGTVWLHVESRRTGTRWLSMDDYVRWHGVREWEQNGLLCLVRNLVQNLGLRRISVRYPRELLFRELPVLLGLTRAGVDQWADQSGRFLEIWKRFN